MSSCNFHWSRKPCFTLSHTRFSPMAWWNFESMKNTKTYCAYSLKLFAVAGFSIWMMTTVQQDRGISNLGWLRSSRQVRSFLTSNWMSLPSDSSGKGFIFKLKEFLDITIPVLVPNIQIREQVHVILEGFYMLLALSWRFQSRLVEDFQLVSGNTISYRFLSLHQSFSDVVVKL